ncbi:MAG: entericidin A/B family lipoprotein [Planctomycetota bacterium]
MESKKTVNPMRIALTGVFVAFALAAAACNTVKGAGQDVEAVGDAIGDATDGESDDDS